MPLCGWTTAPPPSAAPWWSSWAATTTSDQVGQTLPSAAVGWGRGKAGLGSGQRAGLRPVLGAALLGSLPASLPSLPDTGPLPPAVPAAPVTGLPVSTYFSAYKLKWLLDNAPAVAAAAAQGRCMFGTVDSWLIYQLTGAPVAWSDCDRGRGKFGGGGGGVAGAASCSQQPGFARAPTARGRRRLPSSHVPAIVRPIAHAHAARLPRAGGAAGGGLHLTDASNASRTNLMDLRTLTWHKPTLHLFGVRPDMLPDIRSNAEV